MYHYLNKFSYSEVSEVGTYALFLSLYAIISS